MHSINHSLNPVGQLPVFQIVGGLESERKEFLSRLTAVLKSSRLWVKQVVVSEAPGWFRLMSAARQSDLVFVDCPVELSVRKISLSSVNCDGDTLFFGGGGDDRQLESFAGKLRERLDQLIAATPIWACILIGGQSSRMGQPKHLIVAKDGELTWLERIVDLLTPHVDGIILSGGGLVPGACKEIIRLPDIRGVKGPLAGILAATRWNPGVNWLFCACDMPAVNSRSVEWLLEHRVAGSWGCVPRLGNAEHCEPLFAYYDFRAGQLFEELVVLNRLRIGQAGKHCKIDNPCIPRDLGAAWQNVNTPEQLAAFTGK